MPLENTQIGNCDFDILSFEVKVVCERAHG